MNCQDSCLIQGHDIWADACWKRILWTLLDGGQKYTFTCTYWIIWEKINFSWNSHSHRTFLVLQEVVSLTSGEVSFGYDSLVSGSVIVTDAGDASTAIRHCVGKEDKTFMTLFEAKPVILHACACALIKRSVCRITSRTLPSSCEMNQLGFDLSHYTKTLGLETTAISSLHCSKQGFNSWISNVNFCFLIPVYSLLWGHFLLQVRLDFWLLETVPRFTWKNMVTCIFIHTQVTFISTGRINQTTGVTSAKPEQKSQ